MLLLPGVYQLCGILYILYGGQPLLQGRERLLLGKSEAILFDASP